MRRHEGKIRGAKLRPIYPPWGDGPAPSPLWLRDGAVCGPQGGCVAPREVRVYLFPHERPPGLTEAELALVNAFLAMMMRR